MNLLQRATELYDQGFAVIPTKSDKSPIGKGWPDMVGKHRALPNGNFEEQGVAGCGVVLGHWHDRGYLVFLDVDCYDKDISGAMCQFIMEKLDGTFPYRVGQMPKFGVPVLMTDQWRKVKSARYGESHIEMLGLGQQFVAYGAHPKARGGAYRWFNGDMSGDLPVLQESDLWAILEEFERLCDAAGLTKTAEGTRERAAVAASADPLEVAIANQPLDIDTRKVRDTLKAYRAQDLDYDSWLNVGAALHHQYEGDIAGYKLWKKWSAKSDKHNPAQMRKKWESFGGCDRPTTMASVFKAAKTVKTKELTRPKGGFLYPQVSSNLSSGTHIDWVIEDIVESGTIGQIFAAPGTGKTFFALDMAAHLAAGVEWNGRRVVGGPVIYLVGEGVAGIKRRMAAIEKVTGLDLSNLRTSRMPNFGDPDDLYALLQELQAMPIPPVMIIIDTLARAIVGLDENQSKDMGPIVEAMAMFTRKLGCVVMDIHHTPKSNPGEGRGSGALKAAMDFEIKLEGNSHDGVKVSCAKSKDAEAFDDMAFKLVSVKLPKNHTDNFNRRVSSAALEWMKAEDVQQRVNLVGNQAILDQAFDQVFADVANHVHTPPAIVTQFGLDSPAVGCYLDAVKDYFIRSHPANGEMEPKRLTQSFNDALKAVSKKNVIKHFDHILVKL